MVAAWQYWASRYSNLLQQSWRDSRPTSRCQSSPSPAACCQLAIDSGSSDPAKPYNSYLCFLSFLSAFGLEPHRTNRLTKAPAPMITLWNCCNIDQAWLAEML